MLEPLKGTTLNRVRTLVEAILATHEASTGVGDEDRLVDAGLTSMDMVNLMLGVEAEFDVLIPPNEITPGNFRSVASVTALVERVLADA